jgi:predicted CXXCH cytochrome family protein
MMRRRILIAAALMAVVMPASGQLLARSQPPGSRDRTGSTARAPTMDVPREECVTAECHPGVKSRPELHGPVRVNACDACHRMNDAAGHKFEPVRARQEMCTICHAPESMDDAFVHEPFAKGECLSCHDPHGGSGPKLLRGERYADTCAACHQDVVGTKAHTHGPAAVGACGACHLPHTSKRPKLLAADGRELCLKCHVRTTTEIASAAVVHAPVLGDCGVCHDPHASDQDGLLTSKTVDVCTSCHREIADTVSHSSTQHAAVTTKRACTNCHAPHASQNASLLKQEPKTLCFECHNQPIAMPDGSKLVNMKALIETGKSLHGAVTQRGCVECHAIHGSDHRRLLVNEYPSEVYYPFSESSYALCFGCHDRSLVLDAKTVGATGFRNGEENLHFVHVNKEKRGRSCRVCHDAHAANHEKHIRDDVPFGPGGWKLPINYRQLPDGGSCGGACHVPYEYNRVKPVTYPARKPDEAWKGTDLIPGSPVGPDHPKEPGSR